MTVEQKNLMLKINGSEEPLEGIVGIKGAKNAVSKLMLASAVSDKPYTLSNMPKISEVGITKSMLEELGIKIELNGTCARFDGSKINTGEINEKYTGVNRIPILLLGALANKMGSASIPLPGGDPIGTRPIDFHIHILEAFGIKVEVDGNFVIATKTQKRLEPTSIRIPFQSVGATEQFMLTAARIPSVSVLKNAAMEPEVQELGQLLTSMGAIVIFHEESKTLMVEGTEEFVESHHHIKADPLTAVSYLAGSITSNGFITVTDIAPLSIQSALDTFAQMGATVKTGDNWVCVDARQRELTGINITTNPAPGFRTDWQALFGVAATQAAGTSYIHEKVYPNRFVYANVLKEMGADIEVRKDCNKASCSWNGDHPHYAVIKGNGRLQAFTSPLQDIRGAFATVLAAASAEGTSEFTGVHHLIRGYHDLLQSLKDIGMDVELIKIPN